MAGGTRGLACLRPCWCLIKDLLIWPSGRPTPKVWRSLKVVPRSTSVYGTALFLLALSSLLLGTSKQAKSSKKKKPSSFLAWSFSSCFLLFLSCSFSRIKKGVQPCDKDIQVIPGSLLMSPWCHLESGTTGTVPSCDDLWETALLPRNPWWLLLCHNSCRSKVKEAQRMLTFKMLSGSK